MYDSLLHPANLQFTVLQKFTELTTDVTSDVTSEQTSVPTTALSDATTEHTSIVTTEFTTGNLVLLNQISNQICLFMQNLQSGPPN